MWKKIVRYLGNPQRMMELWILLSSICIFAMAVDIYLLCRAFYG